MTNRGKYKHYIEIFEITKSQTKNRLGEYDEVEVSKGHVFANIETRVGGLLTGRPADTVMTSVTHKITWDYNNFPVILPDKNIIKYQGHTFKVNYSLDDGFKHEELQVFVTEKI